MTHEPARAATHEPACSVTQALDHRLTEALGKAQPPATLQGATALLQALRRVFPDDLARWFPLVPVSPPEPLLDPAPQRTRDPARVLGLDASDLRVLYNAIRVVWLAELVFGCPDEARRWLRAPKRRLHGRVPLLLCQHGRYAALIEQWLIDIDEGNGP
ncbi:MbcA/ParS/Xre antitoxin family protein [Achromobacter piechaudii]|uniref:Antitoxin Xre/MbcA/ParS-like toxin-binding domain-containing protein n=1 Tax=Achromobacter piechaudii ATCC 43553 TaxID=742159 RepID=D4XGS0_9BURK|nr:MbcA/ParS/Xre antitoxin family protein [Achromobacter piechaudii]EFF74016.1 hypothetical protein HMPREF0004_4667 [Achromobacter piechaudii ATCC 43553]